MRKLSVRSRMLFRLVSGACGTLKSELALLEALDGSGAASWNRIPSDMHVRSRRVSGTKSGSLRRLVRRSLETTLNTWPFIASDLASMSLSATSICMQKFGGSLRSCLKQCIPSPDRALLPKSYALYMGTVVALGSWL